MADRTFTDGDTSNPVASSWLTDINNVVYRLLGDSSGAGGTGGAPLTRAAVLANLGALSTTDAAATYETIANAAATYETITNAAATYETKAEATALQVGFKNRLVNGSMQIDQVNSGASQAIAASTPTYTVDQWIVTATGGGVTGQRVAGTSTPHMYQITGGAGVTAVDFEQRMEAENISDLVGSQITASFKLSNSLLTAVAWSLEYPVTGLDNWTGGGTVISSGGIVVSPVEADFAVQATLPAGAVNGLRLILSVGAQTSGTWTIASVQIEAGAVQTSFEKRSIAQELFLCQRYYQLVYASLRAPASAGGQLFSVQADLMAQMRATPSALATTVHEGILNVTSYNAGAFSPASVRLEMTSTAAGDTYLLSNQIIAIARL